MPGSKHDNIFSNYWLKIFLLYALVEASIQLVFFLLLNNFGSRPISLIEFHLVMWFFQCLLIWPIWWVAAMARHQSLLVQVFANLAFYFLYSYAWFGPVQDSIGFLYNQLQQLTRLPNHRLAPILDNGDEYSYLNYQLLKHAFRLSWFFLAAYFEGYRVEEKRRMALAVANKELQLKMLTWHLNPSFYFKTIRHLEKLAKEKPLNAAAPILQLARVMEYVIYEAKEKLIDVNKEILFLKNYTGLINQQRTGMQFNIAVSGAYDHLKIAPLLLAGFIDQLVVSIADDYNSECNINLQFSGRQMQLLISDRRASTGLINPGEFFYQRLDQLYPGRFSIGPASQGLTLNLFLDE